MANPETPPEEASVTIRRLARTLLFASGYLQGATAGDAMSSHADIKATANRWAKLARDALNVDAAGKNETSGGGVRN